MRTIVLAGEVDSESAGNFLREFAELDSDEGEIEVRILSPGGDLVYAMAIYDSLRTAKNEVTTLALGEVSSAAVLIFQGGKKRVVGPNCTMLLHESFATGVDGTSSHIIKQAQETERLHKRYCAILAKHAGHKTREISSRCYAEQFLDAQQILDLGLADEKLYELEPLELE